VTNDHSDSLPPHIAPLARAASDPTEDQFDAARTLSEALIKSLGVLIYSDLNRTGLSPDVHVADGLGPLGTWHRLLISLTKRPASQFTSSIANLNNWLGASRLAEPWFSQAQLAVAGMYAALGVPSNPAGFRSALSLIERLVRIRNAKGHGGLTPSLRLAVPPYVDALQSFLGACPCFSWSWTTVAHAWSVEAPQSVVQLVGLGVFDPEDRVWWLLNDYADDNGLAEFIDLLTSDRRRIPVPFKGRGYGLSVEPKAKAKLTPLPVPVTRFVGREEDLEQAKRVLGNPERRLITIHGFGGTGKTRFALQLAAHVQSVQKKTQVSLVRLEATGPAEVLRTVAGQLGLATGSAIDSLADALVEPSMIVLDNFEHLIDEAPAVVTLLERCPNLRVLITSQVPLNVPGEVRIRLQGLRYPESGDIHLEEITAFDAVRLLIDRIRDSKPSFRPTAANAPALVSICRQVGGSPLFLQLIAPFVAKRSAAEVANHLHELLAEAEGTGPSRQRTHRAMISLSFELLSEIEKRMLRRLAYIPGPYPIAAAATVCDLENRPSQARATIEHLVDRGIADLDDSAHVSLHPSVRGFARAQLDEAGEVNDIEMRWFARLIEVLGSAGQAPDDLADGVELAYSYLMVQAACENVASRPDTAFDLATRAAQVDMKLGRPSDAVVRFESILPFSASASMGILARALRAAAQAQYLSSVEGWSNRALEAAEATSKADGYGAAIEYIDGWLQLREETASDFELEDARYPFQQMRVEYARAGVPAELAGSLLALAIEMVDPSMGPPPEREDLERARSSAQEALDLFIQSQDTLRIAATWVLVDVIGFQLGEAVTMQPPAIDVDSLVDGPAEVYSSLKARRELEARARHPMDGALIGPIIRDQIATLEGRIRPGGWYASGGIRIKAGDTPYFGIARRLGVLGGLLVGANDPVVSKISDALAKTRAKCERRLGVTRFWAAFDGGRHMTSMDVARMIGPRIPGDGDHEFGI